MNFSYLPLILLGVFLNAMAQIFLKIGTRTLGYIDFSLKNLLSFALKSFQNPGIWGGIVCYSLSLGIWVVALSRVEVSFAYPLLSIGYVLVALIGYFFLDESLGVSRTLGILVIILGVYLVCRS